MKLIGKGSFTRAYLMEDGQTVKLITKDPCKECVAIGMGSDNALFPKLEQDGWEGDNRVYKMKYFPKVSSLKKSLKQEHYELYSYLKKVSHYLCGNAGNIDFFIKKIEEILPDKFAEEKEAICDHVEGLRNYGEDICFEISPRNVAVDNGKLILLDCFFKRSTLNELRKSF